jgi:hypothetical protein
LIQVEIEESFAIERTLTPARLTPLEPRHQELSMTTEEPTALQLRSLVTEGDELELSLVRAAVAPVGNT